MADKGIHAVYHGHHRGQRGLHNRHAGVQAQDEALEVCYRNADDTDYAGSRCGDRYGYEDEMKD